MFSFHYQLVMESPFVTLHCHLFFDAIRGKENSVIIVISPLNALIKDQVDTFRAKGIKAVRINEFANNSLHSSPSPCDRFLRY